MAVFPFVNLRDPDERWLGLYLRDILQGAITRSGKVALLEDDAAKQWQIKLELRDLAAPSAEQLTAMRITILVHGTMQRVLDSVAVQVRVSSLHGDRLSPAVQSFRLFLKQDAPSRVAAQLVAGVLPAITGSNGADSGTAYPTDWQTIQAGYEAIAKLEAGVSGAERDRLVSQLKIIADQPGMEGPCNAALALMLMQQGVTGDAGMRQQSLQQALDRAHRAAVAESWNSDRLAVLGEAHYFLKQEYQAKTEASIARLKNPLNALAFLVLGLNEGVSSGKGTSYLRQARQINPYMWNASRVPGTAPFQGGILEPTLSHWASVQSELLGRHRRGDELISETLRQGIAEFDARQFDRAARTLARAVQEDEYDYRPVLYQLRILVETGRGAEAGGPLRDLAAEYPDEPEISVQLGNALARGGQPEEARAILQKVLQDDPRNFQALLGMAIALGALGAWEEAPLFLQTLLEVAPTRADGWLQLGITQFNLGHWRDADIAFDKALQRDAGLTAAKRWKEQVRAKLVRPEPTPTRP